MTEPVRVFAAEPMDGFEWVQPAKERDFDGIYHLDGSSRVDGWIPIPMRRLERLDDQGPRLRRADIPWLGEHALVMRREALEAVRDVLNPAGEFLELHLVDAPDPMWLFNVCRVVDALDESGSDLVRFPSSGRVMKVDRYKFRADVIDVEIAFRVPQLQTLFFTNRAVEAFQGTNLSGIALKQLWEGPIANKEPQPPGGSPG